MLARGWLGSFFVGFAFDGVAERRHSANLRPLTDWVLTGLVLKGFPLFLLELSLGLWLMVGDYGVDYHGWLCSAICIYCIWIARSWEQKKQHLSFSLFFLVDVWLTVPSVRYITIYRDIIDQKNLVDLAEIEHTFESSNKFARGFSIRSSILVVEWKPEIMEYV